MLQLVCCLRVIVLLVVVLVMVSLKTPQHLQHAQRGSRLHGQNPGLLLVSVDD